MTEEETQAIKNKTAIPVLFGGSIVGYGHFRDDEFVATIANTQVNNLLLEERIKEFSLNITVVNKEWDNGLSTGYGKPGVL